MSDEKQIWQVAHTPRIKFSSPDDMWEWALKYFKWCDDNPLYVAEQVRKVGAGMLIKGENGAADTYIPPELMTNIPKKRAYTKSGYCLFSGVQQDYLKRMRWDIKENLGGREANAPWLAVLNRIDDAIFTQQYEGGASGQLNPMIVARGIGLVDKTQLEARTTEVKETFKIGDEEFEL